MRRDPPLDVTGRSLLFLDLDGPLNAHSRASNGYCGTLPHLVTRLNRLIRETDCLIVVTSAWRYLVYGGYMTVVGFENLLLTHGFDCRNRIAGITRMDVSSEVTDRGVQIREWLAEYGQGAGAVAVVDDRQFDIDPQEFRLVLVDPYLGITDEHVAALGGILGGRPAPIDTRLREWRRHEAI